MCVGVLSECAPFAQGERSQSLRLVERIEMRKLTWTSLDCESMNV
jgi:hypothetical protein